MHTTHHAAAAALALVGALALTGCSGSTGPSSQPGASLADLGPISQRLKDIYGTGDAHLGAMAQVEEITAACMKEQGFEYTPVGYSSQDAATSQDDAAWGTLEFAQLYGYGVFTTFSLGSPAASPPEEETNPNEAYLATMSPEEQTAYYAALYGSTLVDDEGGSTTDEGALDDRYDWSTAGCVGKAEHEVYGEVDESSIPADLEHLAEQAAEDERVVQAEDDWVLCMSDAGYDYDDIDAPYAYFMDRFNDLFSAASGGESTPGPSSSPAPGEEQDDSGSLDQSTLEQWQQEEIATAVDDHTCQGSSGMVDAKAAALRDLEEAYYADNKAEVDAWLARMDEIVSSEG
jgi:hypothetical protein